MLFPVLLAVNGCAGMPTLEQERQSVSSGLIGCSPPEITISEQTAYTWTATCSGQVFHCTVAPAAACAKRIASSSR